MKPILGHAKPASPGGRPQSLRIGDVARLVGTTPRTIRYYEEIGLLPEARSRPSGRSRRIAAGCPSWRWARIPPSPWPMAMQG